MFNKTRASFLRKYVKSAVNFALTFLNSIILKQANSLYDNNTNNIHFMKYFKFILADCVKMKQYLNKY